MPARGPNKAVPSRTIVAPSAIAASKSPLIPIDSSVTPRRWPSAAQRGELASWITRDRRHRHESRDVESERPAVVDQRVGLSIAHPPFWGSAPTFTSTSTRAPGHAWRASRPAPGGPPMPPRHPRRERPDLVALQPTDEMPGGPGPGERRRLGEELLRPVLAQIPHPGRDHLGHDVGRLRLGRGDEPDRVRSPAARNGRCADALLHLARRARRDSSPHDHDTVTPGHPITPIREVVGGLDRADVQHLDLGHPRAVARDEDRGPEIERGRACGGSAHDRRAEPRDQRREIRRAELVVCRAHTRTDDGRAPDPSRGRAPRRPRPRPRRPRCRATLHAPRRTRCRSRSRSARNRPRSRRGACRVVRWRRRPRPSRRPSRPRRPRRDPRRSMRRRSCRARGVAAPSARRERRRARPSSGGWPPPPPGRRRRDRRGSAT